MPTLLLIYLIIIGVCTLEVIIEYAVYDCTGVSSVFYTGPEFKRFVYTPKDIYNRTKMNWFGCIFCYILLIIFTPHLMLLKWVVPAVIKSIYFIFHAGRCGDCGKCKWFKIEEIPGGVHGVCKNPKKSVKE